MRQVRLPVTERSKADPEAFVQAQGLLVADVQAHWTGLFARLAGPNGDPDLVYELCAWLEMAGKAFVRDAEMIEAGDEGDRGWARAARARGVLFETAGSRAARLAQALCGIEPPPLPELTGRNAFVLGDDEEEDEI
jgi:hypothetical protein